MALSEIMRYSLQPQQDDLASLADEVEHIQNVIEIACLRYDKHAYIDFSVTGKIEDIKVIPLIMITLVENILKHGLISDSENKASISLSVTETKEIYFSTINKKRQGPTEQSTGIGLANIVKRLENKYGSLVHIDIVDELSTFQVVLIISPPKKSHDKLYCSGEQYSIDVAERLCINDIPDN